MLGTHAKGIQTADRLKSLMCMLYECQRQTEGRREATRRQIRMAVDETLVLHVLLWAVSHEQQRKQPGERFMIHVCWQISHAWNKSSIQV